MKAAPSPTRPFRRYFTVVSVLAVVALAAVWSVPLVEARVGGGGSYSGGGHSGGGAGGVMGQGHWSG